MNGKIANYFMYLLLIFSSLGLSILIYRLTFLGISTMNLFQIIFLSTSIFLFFIRGMLSTYLKLFLIGVQTLVVLTVDIYNLGILSSAFQFFIVVPVLYSLVDNFKKSVYYIAFLTGIILVFSILFQTETLTVMYGYDQFLNSYSSWILNLLGFVCVSYVSVYLISIYKKELDKKIDEINELKKELNK